MRFDTSLDRVPTRATVWCAEVDLGSRTARRLAELGVRPGVPLTVQSRTSGHGLIVSVGGVRVALDAAAASGIHVLTAAPVPLPVPA